MNRFGLPIVALLGLGPVGCSIFSALGGGAGGAAFAVDLERYDVEQIDLAFADAGDTMCPGEGRSFVVTARAKSKKAPGEIDTLETAAPNASAKEARGKMDLTEFALEGRGGVVEHGHFVAEGDPFAALLGYDVRATYRLDKSKQVTKHFDPTYACIRAVGSSGVPGAPGESGMPGQEAGQAGGTGGPGGPGGPGPRLVAEVTIVSTPTADRVGLVRVSGDVEQLTLFDLQAGITVSARGGVGGWGGPGGDGAPGSDPQGAGGAGGTGGPGGPGGDGGEVLLVLDDRYPELAGIVAVDVGGGDPGGGGNGGYGGNGGAAPDKACDQCEQPDPGPAGPGGVAGPDGTIAGRPGRSEVHAQDVSAAFETIPPGIRLLDDPHPAPPPVAGPPANARRRRGGRRRRGR